MRNEKFRLRDSYYKKLIEESERLQKSPLETLYWILDTYFIHQLNGNQPQLHPQVTPNLERTDKVESYNVVQTTPTTSSEFEIDFEF